MPAEQTFHVARSARVRDWVPPPDSQMRPDR